MRKIFILLLLTVGLTSGVFGQSPNNVREKLLLDFNWRFYLGDDKAWLPTYICKAFENGGPIGPAFNDSAWRKIDLPHDWAIEQDFVRDESLADHGFRKVGPGYPQTSVGWYRKTFSLNKLDSGKRFSLQFDGVYRNSIVWLNGFFLGNHFSGYTDFNYDITDYVKFGEKNVLVVYVDASKFEGWFYEGAGIYRHTWLIKHNPLYITQYGTYISSQVSKKKTNVHVATQLMNLNGNSAKANLELQVLDESGKVVANSSQAIILSADEQKTVQADIPLNKPELWSIEHPYLYKLVSVVKVGNKIIDRTENNFGVRTLTFDKDHGFLLNGVKVKVKGTCNHQDHAGVGSAIPDRLQYFRIERLKDMGCNAYRTSHNPPTPELLDACDRLGMLVLDETRMLSSSGEYLSQFERLMLRDRNHPSVIAWSIGNEEDVTQDSEIGRRIALSMMNLQKKIDPSRLSTLAANNWNRYYGPNSVIDIRGFNYHSLKSDQYHQDHPNQPVWGTEEASTVSTRGQYINDTIQGFVDEYDYNKKIPWTTSAETWWKHYDAREYMAGGFVWTGFDYRGEPTPFGYTMPGWPCINSHFGIMDMCGFPKNNFYYYQAWWSGKDVLHLYPHWNWQGKTGDTINVWVQTNCENVELFLNQKSLGKKTVEKDTHVEWKVVYEPGILEVKGMKNGKVLTDKVETTGLPYQLVAKPDRTTINGDGEDLSIVTISVLDEKGREVPDANDLVVFDIAGNGKIIGVGNGNPVSHEQDKVLNGKYSRRLFNGKCQVIIQSNKKGGEIILKASSEKLKQDITRIKVAETNPRPAL